MLPAMPSKMCFAVPIPSKQLDMGDDQTLLGPCCPFTHTGKTGMFLASSECLPALSNVLSCLCLKLVLRQEYLSAGLVALPVFKLSLCLAKCVCAKERVISLLAWLYSHFLLFWRRSPEIYTKLLPTGKNDQQTLRVSYCVLL